jgi:hypothetical protein
MKQIEVIKNLTNSYPKIRLEAGDNFYWSPRNKTVFYNQDNNTEEGTWAILHESGHALLDHVQYYTDIELVMMEVEAWEKAKDLASALKIDIVEDHIQDCLDSYRDWLHKRSLCPDCNLSGIQTETKSYSCIFCKNKWNVTSERFCRPYRRRATL